MSELDFPRLSPTDAAGLRETLDELVRGVDAALGSTLLGVYLVGSFALGSGDDQSDVDFAVVTRQPLSRDERLGVMALHRRLPDSLTHGADHLEGSYLPVGALQLAPGVPWLYVDNGSREVEDSNHDNTLTFRWVLRGHGITLFGPEPRSFVDPIDAVDLQREARDRAVQWRDLLRADPSIVDDSWAQTHFVTGLCRLLFTVSTATITSKEKAVAWTTRLLDPRWADLLGAAVQARATTWQRVGAQADADHARRTLELAEEIVRKMR